MITRKLLSLLPICALILSACQARVETEFCVHVLGKPETKECSDSMPDLSRFKGKNLEVTVDPNNKSGRLEAVRAIHAAEYETIRGDNEKTSVWDLVISPKGGDTLETIKSDN